MVHDFGNLYRCASSNVQHICDANCDQRIPLDRYSTICKLSRKVTPNDICDAMEGDNSARKRRTDSPRACSSSRSKMSRTDQVLQWRLQQQDDAMVA